MLKNKTVFWINNKKAAKSNNNVQQTFKMSFLEVWSFFLPSVLFYIIKHNNGFPDLIYFSSNQ